MPYIYDVKDPEPHEIGPVGVRGTESVEGKGFITRGTIVVELVIAVVVAITVGTMFELPEEREGLQLDIHCTHNKRFVVVLSGPTKELLSHFPHERQVTCISVTAVVTGLNPIAPYGTHVWVCVMVVLAKLHFAHGGTLNVDASDAGTVVILIHAVLLISSV